MTEIKPSLAAKIDAVVKVLKEIEQDYTPAVLASSFGAEDMVLMDLICKHAPGIEILRWIQDACPRKPTR